MSTAVETTTQLPVGTWKSDQTHSSANFAVKHMVVATFRGRFDELEATLAVGEDGNAQLIGSVEAGSIVVKDENLQAHLGSPDFFDTERYPELRFVSRSIRRDGEQLVVEGDLTIKDQTHPVEARGTITDPHETLGGAIKIGLTLETIIDRTKFGLNWNAPLPKGGFAVADDVKLTVELELAQDSE
ncbi:MAG TPA: YceI family protein [Solirubrobacteraceae bacterium]|jgi:polyisoprenoid-binding protein YceI|nr:YceI family protein [Solirubrobacteraceae bacterium]